MKLNYALCDAAACSVKAECGRHISNHTDVDASQEILQPNGFVTHDKRCFYFFEKTGLVVKPIEEQPVEVKPAPVVPVPVVVASPHPEAPVAAAPAAAPEPAHTPAAAPAPVVEAAEKPEPAPAVVDHEAPPVAAAPDPLVGKEHWERVIEALSDSLTHAGYHNAAVHVAEAMTLL